MKCDKTILEDYVEGFLKGEDEQRISMHIQACSECQELHSELLLEQKALKSYLTNSVVSTSQLEDIMSKLSQPKKKKLAWQSVKVAIISVAAILIIFLLLYRPENSQQTAIQPADSLLPDDHPDTVVTGGSILDVSIAKIVESGENYDISYRVKFTDWYEEKQNNIFNELMNSYHYISPVTEGFQADFYEQFYQFASTFIQFAIRDDEGTLIVASKKQNENEVPILNNYSLSGDNGRSVGERIYTISIPKNLNPSQLEVLQMEAIMFDPFVTEVELDKLQPIELHDGLYEIEELVIKEEGLVLTISVEGTPERLATAWAIQVENQLFSSNESTVTFENGRTVSTMVFYEFKALPDRIRLLPLVVKVSQENDVITIPIKVGKN